MFKLLSLFSGVGAFEKAFEYLNLEYELVNYCEIDKYASKSYSLIHHVPESMNLGDITKVDTSKLPRDIDLITYGFPCQDISAAGKLKGFVDESGNVTRSGLFFEALRIIEDTKPKIAIAENVKNLVSKKFKTEFTAVLNSLNEAGYNCYWQVLNAKDYGIPQNRERVFIVSIRKDIDNRTFTFPKPFELSIRLRDVLEDEVDEKYYLSQKVIACFMKEDTGNFNRRERFLDNIEGSDGEIGHAITTRSGSRPTDNFVVERTEQERRCDEALDKGELKEGDVINHSHDDPNPVNTENPDCAPTLTTRGDELGVVVMGNYSPSGHNAARVVDPDGIAPTVMENHGTVTAILIKNNTKKGYLLAEEGDAVDISGRMQYHRGTVQKGISQTITTAGGDNVGVVVKDKNNNELALYKDTKLLRETIENASLEEGEPKALDLYNRSTRENVAQTLDSGYHNTQRLFDGLRIRKLTPKECFRLMGFKDYDIDTLLNSGVSNTQLYKQAGNSIVINVIEQILAALFELPLETFTKQVNVFDD